MVSSTSMGGHVTIWAFSNSSTCTSWYSIHMSFNSFGHSSFGHSGTFGSGTFSFCLSFLGIEGISVSVAEFALYNRTNGQPLCRRCNFFCVIQLNRKVCERFGQTSAMVCVYPCPPMFWIWSLHVPRTFMALPSADISSIIC